MTLDADGRRGCWLATPSRFPIEEANGPKAIFSFAALFAAVHVDPELGLAPPTRPSPNVSTCAGAEA